MYALSDGDGLQLRIKPNGSKIWLLDYRRPYTKVRTSMSFGAYPTLSLADARKKRTEARVLLAQDIDPKEHALDSWRSLELHIFPALGKLTHRENHGHQSHRDD